MKSRPLLIWQSVLAGMQLLSGATAVADLVPEKWAALFTVVVGAMQVGTATYVHGLWTLPSSTPVVIAQKDTTVRIQAVEAPDADPPVEEIQDPRIK